MGYQNDLKNGITDYRKNEYVDHDEIKHSWDAQDRRVTVSASDTLREGVEISLDATEEGRPLYERLGFVPSKEGMVLVKYTLLVCFEKSC